jgi:hypothetical protein
MKPNLKTEAASVAQAFAQDAANPPWKLPSPLFDARCRACWFTAALLVLVVASFVSLDLDWAAFASMEAARSMGRFVAEFFPPDLSPVFVNKVVGAAWETLAISALGTVMAAALGLSPPRVYMVTFGIGAALAGLAGGVLAPITGVVPTIGVAYVAKAFITVIGGGASILAGTLSASTLFGTVNQLATFATTPVIGEVALLFTAIVLVRLMPQGITARFFRRSL